MDNNVKKSKGSIFSRQKNTIIALAIIFAVLLGAYLLIIRPLMKDDAPTEVKSISLIWQNEVESSSGIMMYKHIPRESIARISVHNPSLASKSNGRYVDWAIYRVTEDKKVGGVELEKGELYLEGYEYAPLEDNDTSSVVASVINDSGFALALSRVIDHAKDLSKYGLDFESDDEATYCEITSLEGETYRFYVGDKIPSGNAYYVRIAGKDVCLDKNSEFYGQEIENDSVYIYDCSSVLISPTDVVSPILTTPLNASLIAYFDSFIITEYTENDEEGGNIKVDFSSALKEDHLAKPISSFAQNAIYYAKVPAGYHSSSAFEGLFESFVDGLRGSKVIELAELIDKVDEETKETYQDFGFTSETLNKYFKNNTAYMLAFKWNAVNNVIMVSRPNEEGNLYVYSLVYDTISEVSADTLSFLNWKQSAYIDKDFFKVNITNCSKFEVKGNYYELSGGDYVNKKVDAAFDLKLEDNEDVSVSSPDFAENGSMSASQRTENFRTLYQLLLLTSLSEKIDSSEFTREELDEIIKNKTALCAEISVTTRAHTKTVADPESETGEDKTITVPGMTRTYRFYKLTSGRMLMTTQDGDGEEVGDYYIKTSSVETLLIAANKVKNDELVNKYERY
ncbi:MAG: DUF4340 domain-containing protein [Ruminococcaceae bacterium]|nr:DUF4340 domain-containing protein [Oscillospiraceae bacterium]